MLQKDTITEKIGDSIQRMVTRHSWNLRRPLPTTRELGRMHGASNASAYRILHKLQANGLLWQAPSGRYYHSKARPLIEKPRPIACLLRRIESWFACYQEIMAGVSQGCGEKNTEMLFSHNETLVQHLDVQVPPQFGSLENQSLMFDDFLNKYHGMIRGILLDGLWKDEVVVRFKLRFQNIVVLERACDIEGISTVSVDARTGGMLALSHLLDRGYEEIWIIIPFYGYSMVDSIIKALLSAASQAGCKPEKLRILPGFISRDREQIVQEAASSPKRIGLYCPEDNVARLTHQKLVAADVACPEKVGVLSGLGAKIAQDAEISSIQFNFQEMGRIAASLLCDQKQGKILLSPTLLAGKTT